jgi:hypothetical protein
MSEKEFFGTSEYQFPGAFEEDELAAVAFAGASGAFANCARILQIIQKLGLVTETSWPGLLR